MKIITISVALLAVPCTSLHVPFHPRDHTKVVVHSLDASLGNTTSEHIHVGRLSGPGSLDTTLPGDDNKGYTDAEYKLLMMEGCSLIGMMATPDNVAATFIRPAYTHSTAASPFDDVGEFGLITPTGFRTPQ